MLSVKEELPLRILLVDDSKTIRGICRRALTEIGHSTVEEAADGVEALAKCETFNPELILLDWNMPNMDGLSFLKTYRAQGKKTPIIMVTTEAEKTRVIEAIKAGVNNYCIKPFTVDSLSQRINDTMAKVKAA